MVGGTYSKKKKIAKSVHGLYPSTQCMNELQQQKKMWKKKYTSRGNLIIIKIHIRWEVSIVYFICSIKPFELAGVFLQTNCFVSLYIHRLVYVPPSFRLVFESKRKANSSLMMLGMDLLDGLLRKYVYVYPPLTFTKRASIFHLKTLFFCSKHWITQDLNSRMFNYCDIQAFPTLCMSRA